MITFLIVLLYVLLTVLLLASFAGVAGLVWRYYLSLWTLDPDEVGILLHFGEPQRVIYGGGKVYVPWCPIRWGKHYWYELVTIPTRQFPFKYEGAKHVGEENEEKHYIWSSDRQRLLIEVSGYIRFPFKEIDSLLLMIRARVPLTDDELKKWIEEEVISGLRDIMAEFTLDQSLARSNLSAIRAKAQEYFLRADGLFARSGIYGNDLDNDTEGHGEIILRIEQINPTERMQKAMEAPVVAKYEAAAASAVAVQKARLIGGPLLEAMNAWVANQTLIETPDQALARLKADGGLDTWIQPQLRPTETLDQARQRLTGSQELDDWFNAQLQQSETLDQARQRLTGSQELDDWFNTKLQPAETPDQALARLKADGGLDTWIQPQLRPTETVEQARKRLQDSGAYDVYARTMKDLILANGGDLAVSRVEFGAPNGGPLPPGLKYLSVGGGAGGGGAGVFVGDLSDDQGKSKKKRNKGGTRRGHGDAEENLERAFEDD